MQIVYYDIASYREIQLQQSDIPRFLDFDYQYDQPVTDDMIDVDGEYMKFWIQDVKDLKAGLYDSTSPLYPFTHFTKLPYMYSELLNDGCYKFPVFYRPTGESINGSSRMLILTQYFPQLTWDAVRYKFNNQTSETLTPLVDSILLNKYWTTHTNDYTKVRALLEIERDSNSEIYYSLSDINFVNHPPFVFGKDWTVGTDYVESYDYTAMIDKLSRTQDLWNKIYKVIKEYPINSIEDYKKLLDIVVLDNLEFINKWQRDFL